MKKQFKKETGKFIVPTKWEMQKEIEEHVKKEIKENSFTTDITLLSLMIEDTLKTYNHDLLMFLPSEEEVRKSEFYRDKFKEVLNQNNIKKIMIHHLVESYFNRIDSQVNFYASFKYES